MESFINNFLFTYFPHIAFATFWFGIITRFSKANRTIQAKSTQLLADKNVKLGSNLFHYGIVMVVMGHLTLLIPEELYHIFISTETKRMIALTVGSLFGSMAIIGMILLLRRRVVDSRIRYTSRLGDYLILILLLTEALLGMASVATTATSSIEEYAALGIWAQKIVTFQPDAGAVLANHSILYKVHITIGLLIFMIFPYTKLMHMLVYPFVYFLRWGYQLVRRMA